MKTFLRYIWWGLLAGTAISCSKDPEFETTDVGPVMEKIALDERASMGDIITYEFRLSDPLPLSTLEAELYFDNDLVASRSLRVKTNGTYRDTLSVPFYKEIPDGRATLLVTGRNIRFGETRQSYKVEVVRPDFDHLTFVMEEAEYRMERIAEYEYAVTADFPQKAKGYIETPAFESGRSITFGWDVNQVIAGSTTEIPFSQSNAGEYTISFNTKTFAASPFTKLLFNGEEMTMVDNDNYAVVTMLTQGLEYELSGIPDFLTWDVDCDFFERKDDSRPELLTFLPMSGQYKVTANFKHNYLKIEAMKSATELAVLNGDGSGAVWAIGGTSVGKPSLRNAFDWKPESGGLCLARVGSTRYQLTLVGGISIDTKSVDFKFFHQKTWGGEFGGGKITSTSDLFVAGETDGNIRLATGKTLTAGNIYRFTLDVTPDASDTKLSTAVLSVEEIEGELPAADIRVNGQAMTQTDLDNYSIDLDLVQGEEILFSGADMFDPVWCNPDFFDDVSQTPRLVPVSGKYRITVNRASQIVDALVLKADGSGLATLSDDGHGAIYYIGYGIGSPAAANEPAWTTEKGICIPEYAPQIYKITAQAGQKGSTVPGQRFRVSEWSGKFFKGRNWDGITPMTLAPGTEEFLWINPNGNNLEINPEITLEEGATYELTVDVTNGNNNPIIIFVKK